MKDFLLIEAANGAKPKVQGMAYGGGKMNLPGWKHPVVVDLVGMEIPDTVPLLTNHENKTDSRVGMISASIKNNTLEISGEIISDSNDAKDIVAQSKAGAPWQLSIGADVKECELIKGNLEINGQNVEGPFYHIKKSILREVSVVAVGADAQTTMKVSAKFNLNNNQKGDKEMSKENDETKNEETKNVKVSEKKEEQKPKKSEKMQVPPNDENEDNKENSTAKAERGCEQTQSTIQASGVDVGATAQIAAAAAVKAERERINAIKELCGSDYPEIEQEAISAGWTEDIVAKKVLAMIRAERPASNVSIQIKSKPEGSDMRKTLEAAMSLRCGVNADILEKSYGGKVVEAGMSEMDMPLRQLLVECMKLDGIPYSRGFDNESIRAAFSSVSLPGILSNVANKKLLQSYEAQPIIATKLCSTGDLNDFKENDRFRLTDVGDLNPIAADGEIKDGGIIEESAKNQLDTYGKKFCLTRKMIINDDLGAFMKVPSAMGNRAARLIDQLFFSRLLKNPLQANGKNLFHSSHKNLLTGATSALSPEALKKAIGMFLDQVDADGQPISVEPKYLLVPTALKHTAIELTQGATLIMSGADNAVRPALNVLADENLQVVSSPYLGNSAYTGNSQTGWYLFGDPKQIDTWEIGYLKGKRTPTVERGETDFNTLGLWFRVYFDLGVREQDHRGMVKSTGVAN